MQRCNMQQKYITKRILSVVSRNVNKTTRYKAEADA